MAGNKLTIGNVEITSLSDGILEFDVCNFFPSIPQEEWSAHPGHLTDDHKVSFNLASFLIRSDAKTIIVDTGLGPKPADAPETPWGELLTDFEAHGVKPEEVDMVVMTHLHRDHVGWNLRDRDGRYEATFPNARYWLSSKDYEATRNPELMTERFPNAPTCVWPLEELDLIEFMDGETALTSELTAVPTPGHTPGHVSIMINSQGQRGIVIGDVLHNTVQIQETDWVSRADIDPGQTRATRRSLMELLEREGMPVAAVHLAAPGFGRIVRLQDRRVWQAL